MEFTRVYSPGEKYVIPSSFFLGVPLRWNFKGNSKSRCMESLLGFRYSLSIIKTIIKLNANILKYFFHSTFNNSIHQCEFPSILQLENIEPIFEEGSRNSRGNYKLVSIPSNTSKIFEQSIFYQIWTMWI